MGKIGCEQKSTNTNHHQTKITTRAGFMGRVFRKLRLMKNSSFEKTSLTYEQYLHIQKTTYYIQSSLAIDPLSLADQTLHSAGLHFTPLLPPIPDTLDILLHRAIFQ